jgi:hypothetical protein
VIQWVIEHIVIQIGEENNLNRSFGASEDVVNFEIEGAQIAIETILLLGDI